MMSRKFAKRSQAGFTMIEMMISVALIILVVGAIFRQIQRSQASYRVEDQKLDMTQQEREFIDQFTRDLRQAGYPGPFTFGITPPVNLSDTRLSAGITSISPTSVTMEGDLDNSGQVQIVTYSYVAGGATCPCIQRSTTPKAGGAIQSYIAVRNLVNPAALNPPRPGIFAAYQANGNGVGLPLVLAAGATTNDGSYANLHAIKSVQVTFTIQNSTTRELNGKSMQVTMTGMARIPND